MYKAQPNRIASHLIQLTLIVCRHGTVAHGRRQILLSLRAVSLTETIEVKIRRALCAREVSCAPSVWCRAQARPWQATNDELGLKAHARAFRLGRFSIEHRTQKKTTEKLTYGTRARDFPIFLFTIECTAHDDIYQNGNDNYARDLIGGFNLNENNVSVLCDDKW